MSESPSPCLRLKNISKKFGGIQALNGVTFEAFTHEIHAVVGHNGAGKSTLVKTVLGAYQPDAGTIELYGNEVSFSCPQEAMAQGITMVWQELVNFPNITVAENVLINRYIRNQFGGINWKGTYEQARAQLQRVNLSINPKTKMAELSLAQQQLAEVAKALSYNASVIILDEPTSALSHHEQEILFQTVRNLKDQGLCIIYITHKMEEVFKLSDRVTILRNGERIISEKTNSLSVKDVVQNIIGKTENGYKKQAEQKKASSTTASSPMALEARNLSIDRKLDKINFSVRKGEVIGIVGLEGSGTTEIGKILFGAQKDYKGEIFIQGKKRKFKQPKEAVKHGLGYVPKNRKEEGLVPQMTMMENIGLPSLKAYGKFSLVNYKKMREAVFRVIKYTNLQPPRLELPAASFSGGNQQKIVLSRWIATDIDVLVLDEPTRGVDIGAIKSIYEILHDIAARGCAVIVLSSEFQEVHPWMNRILVVSKGSIIEEVDPRKVPWEEVLSTALKSS